MKKIQLICLLAVFATAVSLSSPARAQLAGQAYASPGGTGNTCSGSTPCNLDQAIAVTGPAGITSCINGGFMADGFAPVQSITINCPGAVLTTDGFSSPVFQFGGTTSQVAILRNLTFRGNPQGNAPFIKVSGGTTLIIENCRFENSANNTPIAVQFQPVNPAAQLIIRDSVFANNGIAPSSGGALQVAPGAGGSASVVLERVSFNFNVTAIALSGPVNATMINSTVSASRSNGILVGSGSTLVIEDSKLLYNAGAAVSIASGGTLRLSNDTIESNQIGIKNGGGQALTYSNNRVFGNGSTATLTPIQGGQ